jgi:hypothetical protein
MYVAGGAGDPCPIRCRGAGHMSEKLAGQSLRMVSDRSSRGIYASSPCLVRPRRKSIVSALCMLTTLTYRSYHSPLRALLIEIVALPANDYLAGSNWPKRLVFSWGIRHANHLT